VARVARTREEVIEDLLDLDRHYAAFVQNYSREQLNWRPANGAWSVAQCIQHVARVNEIYLSTIKAATARDHGRSGSKEPLQTAGWFSARFLKSVSPEGKPKLPAPRMARPSLESPTDPVRELQKLQGTHAEIREMLTSSQQPDLNRLRFRSPFIPLIHFTVASGILIMAAHGRRHLLQAERVCNVSDFPRAEAAGRIA